MSWAAALTGLAGAGLSGVGSYIGGKENAKAANSQLQLGHKANAFTQLLGLSQLGQFQGDMDAGLQDYLGQYGNAAGLTSLLPGVAQQGQQAQLGQVAGAEKAGIAQMLKNQTAALGANAQNAVGGLSGSSTAAGQANQIAAMTSQNIANLMSQNAGVKAGIIGQGTQNTMQGILAAASGQQALGDATMGALGMQYQLVKDKLNTILATGNAWGVGDYELAQLQRLSGGLHAAGAKKQGWSLGPGEGIEDSIWQNTIAKYGSGYNLNTQKVNQWTPWEGYAGGFLSGIWD